MKANNKTFCLTYENVDTIFRFLTYFTFLGSTLDNMQTLQNMWIFSLLVKLKTVILVLDISDNTPFNIACKDETEQYEYMNIHESVNMIFQFIKHNLDKTRFNREKNEDIKQ